MLMKLLAYDTLNWSGCRVDNACVFLPFRNNVTVTLLTRAE